jgi:hypothetical protein
VFRKTTVFFLGSSFFSDFINLFLKAQKRDLFHSLGYAMGRGRVRIQLIFSHLWGTDMSNSVKYTKDLGAGDKEMYN